MNKGLRDKPKSRVSNEKYREGYERLWSKKQDSNGSGKGKEKDGTSVEGWTVW